MVEAQVPKDVDGVTEAKVAEDIDAVDIVSGPTLRVLELTLNTASPPNRPGRMTSIAINVVAVDTSRKIVPQSASMTHEMDVVTRPSVTTVSDLGTHIRRVVTTPQLHLWQTHSMPSATMHHQLLPQPLLSKLKIRTINASLMLNLDKTLSIIKPTPFMCLHHVQLSQHSHLRNVNTYKALAMYRTCLTLVLLFLSYQVSKA